MLRYIATQRAAAAIGPYHHGVVFGDLLFCSGQPALAGKGLSQEIERAPGCEVGADNAENEDQDGALMVQHPS